MPKIYCTVAQPSAEGEFCTELSTVSEDFSDTRVYPNIFSACCPMPHIRWGPSQLQIRAPHRSSKPHLFEASSSRHFLRSTISTIVTIKVIHTIGGELDPAAARSHGFPPCAVVCARIDRTGCQRRLPQSYRRQ